MGSLGGDNGDGWTPDGGGQPERLPGLPPDWGPVTIPDDPSALAEESAAVRRELRRLATRARLRRIAGLPPELRPGAPPRTPPVRLPIMIMMLAVVATLTSLFLVTWAAPARRTTAPTAAHNGGAPAIPPLTLTDDHGKLVPLREVLPAVLILAEGCSCGDLVAAAAEAAPAGVAVIAVGRTAPSLPQNRTPVPAVSGGAGAVAPAPILVRALADREQALRGRLGLPSPGPRATVLLARRDGRIVRTIAAVTSVEEFRADLPQLAAR